ncbi:ATP-grasp domain-containing protein [Sorangium sp. So ce726]|uniref:ATP-grasp domain-containing protein n=1 Tax=Sorangium sp. So ce726 TaxID=3133319 RepID=UPI003F5E97F8
MKTRPRTIAVTGLNATDNPAPGVGVIRALRAGGDASLRIVGLAYDALDPGAYAGDIVSDVFMIPYPSQGLEAFVSRLEYVHRRVGLDVIIPTLDAELPSFIDIAPRLHAMGIGTCLPTREQLDLRSKASLAALGARAGIRVPRTAALSDADELLRIHERVPYPFHVKGVFYGATLATTFDEAVSAYYKVIAQWGLPVLVQEHVSGEEFDVVAVGDGEGGLVGAVPMKKMLLTDKGKGWAGITVRDPELVGIAQAFAETTRWRGPFEVEVMRDAQGRYHLIEVNPRFPAWVYLSVAAGMNLPRAVVDLAAGAPIEPLRGYEVGAMFVRISIDQVARISDFQSMVTTGELVRSGGLS